MAEIIAKRGPGGASGSRTRDPPLVRKERIKWAKQRAGRAWKMRACPRRHSAFYVSGTVQSSVRPNTHVHTPTGAHTCAHNGTWPRTPGRHLCVALPEAVGKREASAPRAGLASPCAGITHLLQAGRSASQTGASRLCSVHT